jgi:hypothetical protein
VDYDSSKLKETILTLLGTFEPENGRVSKRYDFAIMVARHANGYI